MIKNFFIRVFRQLRSRRALARYSSAIACGVLAAIPNTSCSKKSASQSITTVKTAETDVKTSAQKIDLDFTKMSATMVYSQVFNMLIDPDFYENKVIKAKGTMAVVEEPETNSRYFAIIIKDATACCQEGIDFVWVGNHEYPDDYPPENTEITLTGRYVSTEIENGITYCYLLADELVW